MVLPSSSDSVAVTVSVSLSPALPFTAAVKLHEYEPLAESVCGTEQVPCPARLPWTSSERAVNDSDSAVPVLSIWTLKVTLPPGSATVVGKAAFVTVAVGATSVIVTVAESIAVTGTPTEVPEAVTVSVSESPALPLTAAVKLHEYEPLTASVCGTEQVP